MLVIDNLHSSSQDLCSAHTYREKETAIVLVIRSLGALKKLTYFVVAVLNRCTNTSKTES